MARRTGRSQSELQPAKLRRQHQRTRNFFAAIFFLATLGLVGGLIYYLLIKSPGKTYFVAIYEDGYAEGIDWNVYVKNDVAFLIEQLNLPDNTHIKEVPIVSESDLLPAIEDMVFGPKDHLIFYYAVNGLVEYSDDEPPVAKLQTSNTTDGGVPITKVLEGVNSIECASKLILFEAGPQDLTVADLYPTEAPDIRIQEKCAFPYFLIQAIQSQAMPNTWAICSHRMFERSNLLRVNERSVFAHAVGRAFQDLTETDKTSIHVQHLYEAIKQHCWSLTSLSGQVLQTPLLVDCSNRQLIDTEGKLGALPEAVVAVISPLESGADANQADQGRKPRGTETAADAQDKPAYQELWELVAELEDRTVERPHSPVDFAPSLWALYLEQIIDEQFESELSVITNSVEGRIDELTALRKLLANEPVTVADFQGRLLDFAQAYRDYQSRWQAGLVNQDQDGEPLRVSDKLLRSKARDVGKIRDYVFKTRFCLLLHAARPLEGNDFDRLATRSLWLLGNNKGNYQSLVKALDLNTIQPSAGDANSSSSGDLLDFEEDPAFDVNLNSPNVQRSQLAFERALRASIIATYLAHDKKAEPVLIAGNEPRTESADQLENVDFALCNKWLFELRFQSMLNLVKDSAGQFHKPFTSDLQVFAPTLNIEPTVIVSDSTELGRRRLLASGGSLAMSEKFPAPSMVWQRINRTIALSASPGSLDLLAVDHQQSVQVVAELNEVDPAQIQWAAPNPAPQFLQVSRVPASDNSSISLVITPKTDRTDEQLTETSFPITVTAKYDEGIVDQATIHVQLPKPDSFLTQIKNQNWDKNAPPVSEPLTDDFAESLSPATIQPLPSIPTEFQFELINDNLIAKKLRVELYSLKTSLHKLTDALGELQPGNLTLESMQRRMTKIAVAELPESIPPGQSRAVVFNKPESEVPKELRLGPLLLVCYDVDRGSRPWFRWIELDRVPAGSLLDWTNKNRPQQGMIFAQSPRVTMPLGYEVLLDSSEGTVNIASQATRWEISRNLDQASPLLLVDVMNEPRALRYQFNGSVHEEYRNEWIKFDVVDTKLVDKGLVVPIQDTIDGVGATTWLVMKDAIDAWHESDLLLKLDFDEEAERVPWMLRLRNAAVPTAQGLLDRRVTYQYALQQDGSLHVLADVQDIHWRLEEGQANQVYEVLLDNKVRHRLEVITEGVTPPTVALKINRTEISLQEKSLVEFTVETESAYPIASIIIGKKELAVDPMYMGKRSFVVEKADLQEILEGIKEGETAFFKAEVTDFFGQKRDHTAELVVTKRTGNGDPTGSGMPKPEPGVSMTISIKDLDPTVNEISIDGISIPLQDNGDFSLGQRQNVSVDRQVKNGKHTFVLKNLQPKKYQVTINASLRGGAKYQGIEKTKEVDASAGSASVEFDLLEDDDE